MSGRLAWVGLFATPPQLTPAPRRHWALAWRRPGSRWAKRRRSSFSTRWTIWMASSRSTLRSEVRRWRHRWWSRVRNVFFFPVRAQQRIRVCLARSCAAGGASARPFSMRSSPCPIIIPPFLCLRCGRSGSKGILDRNHYEANKDHFDAMVDYSITPTI